jgi:hypothetical protein
MWGEFPFVFSQSKLNFDADQILEGKADALSVECVRDLWDKLDCMRKNSINTLNALDREL